MIRNDPIKAGVYRRGVGIILLNQIQEIFIAHRCKRGAGTETSESIISHNDIQKIEKNKWLDKLERKDLPSLKDYLWQMPQGGIEIGEDYEKAALRELAEETGIASVEVLKVGEREYFYDLPSELSYKVWDGKYKGQVQRWVLMRFMGQEAEINLKSHFPQEFDAWRWAPAHILCDIVTPFKRNVYNDLKVDFNLL